LKELVHGVATEQVERTDAGVTKTRIERIDVWTARTRFERPGA
jgi:hypothetical protein